MYNSGVPVLSHALSVIGGISIAAAALWGSPQRQQAPPLRLPSGRDIDVISMTPVKSPDGGSALALDYRTELNLADAPRLIEEVHQIWLVFKLDVEKEHLRNAIIVPHGATGKGFSFVFTKHDTGEWSLDIEPSHVVKIKVFRDGTVVLDDRPVTIAELKSTLLSLGTSPGAVVFYYREVSSEQPPESAMLVMRAIVEARLPVRLSTKPDFSDAVTTDRRPDPQK
jgi:hypothetical protein